MVRLACAYCLVLFCTIWFSNSVGQWKDLTDAEVTADEFASYYKWRGPVDREEFTNATLLVRSFTSHSLCKALTVRDNCFSHNPKRADLLLHRSLGSLPLSLNASVALKSLQNQNILFVGDSTVVSVYASLVCHFSQFAEVTYQLMWLYERNTILSDGAEQDQCPGHPSCHLIHGQSHIASHNITFIYQQLNLYRAKEKDTFKRLVEEDTWQPTVVIINFGVHYNHERPYMHELRVFSEDMVSLLQRQRAANAPIAQWYWLESFPQHFPREPNADLGGQGGGGYYDSDAVSQSTKPTGSLRCAVIVNKTHYFEEDWRNRLTEIFLPDFKRSARLISIAEALYDQWDAHVDYGDSLRVASAKTDCTHYCLGSGVFRYVLDQLLTSLVKCLRGQCKDNHFFDGYVEPKPKPKPPVHAPRAAPIQRCSRIPGAARNKPAVGVRSQPVPRGKRDPNCA